MNEAQQPKPPSTAKAASASGLSPTMRQLVGFALSHGGEIVRFPGGFWIAGPPGDGRKWGASTIEALVQRGCVEYSEWREGRGGRFPVKARVISEYSTTKNRAVRRYHTMRRTCRSCGHPVAVGELRGGKPAPFVDNQQLSFCPACDAENPTR